MKKYLNYLLFLGIIIATAGIIAGKISENWSILSISLSIAGGVILVIWLGLFLKSNKNFWHLPSTEVVTNAILSTVSVILILGMINFLGFRYSTKIDFTETKLFTLSPQSQQLLTNLPEDVKVYIFKPSPETATKALLTEYKRKSNNFDFEFVNPQLNVKLAKEFNVQRIGEVYLKYKDKKQLIQTISEQNPLSESQLSNAIAKILLDKQFVVYILQGHGEPELVQKEGSLSQAVDSLKDKGYIVKPLFLTNNPLIPPDANAVVIANPQRKLLKGEVTILEKYLNQGGNLLVMLNAYAEVGLDSLLAEWGITLDQRLVVDSSGTGNALGLGPATSVIIDYGSHPITKDFINSISIFPLARPINTTKKDNIEAIALLITNNQTWAESEIGAEEVEFDPIKDIPGPLDIGVALERKISQNKTEKNDQKTDDKEQSNLKTKDNSDSNITEKKDDSSNENKKEINNNNNSENEDNNFLLPEPNEPNIPKKKDASVNVNKSNLTPSSSKIVIIGNANFATNGWFSQQINGDVFFNSVSWLANDEGQILSIRPKEAKNRRLNLSNTDSIIISWLPLGLSTLGFMAAFITWLRRNNN